MYALILLWRPTAAQGVGGGLAWTCPNQHSLAFETAALPPRLAERLCLSGPFALHLFLHPGWKAQPSSPGGEIVHRARPSERPSLTASQAAEPQVRAVGGSMIWTSLELAVPSPGPREGGDGKPSP